MRALVTRLRPDKRREKVLVSDWPAPEGPTGNQVKSRTIYSGITNGTEHNDLVGGNYAHPDDALPAGWGYQHVGRVIETGPDVAELAVGDLLYINADHKEYVVAREDGLLIKLPEEVDPRQAALFGMSSVAMRTCRHADLRMGERVLVVGQGFVGQMAAQIANVMGARVAVCEVDPGRLEMARRIGAAEEVFDVAGDGWEKQIADGAFDALIDAAGVEVMEDRLIRALKSRAGCCSSPAAFTSTIPSIWVKRTRLPSDRTRAMTAMIWRICAGSFAGGWSISLRCSKTLCR